DDLELLGGVVLLELVGDRRTDAVDLVVRGDQHGDRREPGASLDRSWPQPTRHPDPERVDRIGIEDRRDGDPQDEGRRHHDGRTSSATSPASTDKLSSCAAVPDVASVDRAPRTLASVAPGASVRFIVEPTAQPDIRTL